MLAVAAVFDLLAHHAQSPSPQTLPLADAAGLRLAQPVAMDADAPPFDRSLVDGYALRAADAVQNAQLSILGHQDAGRTDAPPVSAGTCIAVNTGAPIPPGADAVVMVEDTAPLESPSAPASPSSTAHHAAPRARSAGALRILRSLSPGAGIQRRAADAHLGQQVLPPGTLLGPAQLAVAAAAGAARVSVFPRPTAAVFATGDELVPPDQSPGPAQIRNTNGLMLENLVREAGAALTLTAALRDEAALLRHHFARALEKCDLLIVTGGMSMGTRDLVPQILLDLGVAIHVQTVCIKPGKPFLFGTLLRPHMSTPRYIFGLPGNPVSGFVCFQRFVRPLIDRLAGGPPPSASHALACAVTAVDLPANTEREFYQPAHLAPAVSGRPATVTPLHWRGSADIFTLARAAALIIHPPHAPARPAGATVDILPL